MDLQILCARRVNENNHHHHHHSSANEMISSSGSGSASPLKLPSLVPPATGMWFQDQAKLREKPPEGNPSDSAVKSPQSPPWFPQQNHQPQQQPSKDLRDAKPNGNNGSVWFQPESQEDSTNVNVVSTNDSAADDSDEDDDSGGMTNEPVDTTPEATSHNPAPPVSTHDTLPPPATSMMAPWFLAQKAKESMVKPPELNIPTAQHHHAISNISNMSWFLGNKETPNKLPHESNNKISEHNAGPWYLGQHKINVNNSEHNKDQSSPNKEDEGPWFLGQSKTSDPPHKQSNGWFHHTDIKVEQDTDTMDKRQEDAVKSGCVWFGHGLLKPDADSQRQDNLSKMMGAWFSSSHMMRPDMVKQEAGTGMHPSGFWFIPGSSASANCNGGGANMTAAHGGGKLYQCDLCQTQFRQRERLREHRRIHALGETPHTCTICEKAFTTAAARECHAAVAHLNGAGHPPGPCRFCEAGDTQHLEHMAMHNHDGSLQPPLRRQGGGIRRPGGPGGYECKMCGLRFPDGPSLTDHVDHHPGGRPLLCRLCCKTFKSKLGLENHTRLHTGERPFECGECGARFPQRAALDYHVKGRHTGENHRTCGRCGKLFRSTPGYNNHMRLHAVRDTASVNNNAAVVAAAAVAAAGVMAGSAVSAVSDAVGNILSGTGVPTPVVGSNKEHHPH
ncbi:uncharacterized protein LOC135944611 isoform X1 [Cloeon dipterum]|uniref:uncharacterized protein LOC135944611 isoform X1 n=1 Tax=Cloeon dipterum TaxID=197152 RepID=UPI0032201D91